MWSSGPIDPEAIKIHRIRPADLKNAPRFPTILPKVKDFVGDSPIVAHAYKNERDFLDYEFARAKVIPWGESAYADECKIARNTDPLRGDFASNSGSDAISVIFTAAQVAPINLA